MSAAPHIPPGDRYLTSRPCGPHCCGRSSSSFPSLLSAPSPIPLAESPASAEWIAVKPYSFVFRAPVKGRWLGRGLLDLFLHEFAFVPCDPDSDDEGREESSHSNSNDNSDPNRVGSVSTAHARTRSAVIPLLLRRSSSGSAEEAMDNGSKGGDGAATLDRRFTLPAYVEELCDSALWLHGREAECRAAGRGYRDALIQLAYAHGAGQLHVDEELDRAVVVTSEAGERRPSSSSLPFSDCAAIKNTTNAIPSSFSSSSTTTSVNSDTRHPSSSAETNVSGRSQEWAAWCRTVRWLSQLPSEADVDALMPQLHLSLRGTGSTAASVASSNRQLSSPPPPPLMLRQRDTVHHRVWRREGRMLAQPPLQLLRCDIAAALSKSLSAVGRSPSCATEAPALMVVSKPPGLPVHPSGCYRKNSVTSILEDVFGGCESGQRYVAEEHFTEESGANTAEPFRPYASIVHRRDRFELIRVFVRSPSEGVSAAAGVSAEDWRLLKELLYRGTSDSGDEKATAKVVKSSGTASCSVAAMKRARDAEDGEAEQQGSADSPSSRPVASIPPHYTLKAYVVHRLDAATSGVLLFGLDSDSARRTAEAIANKAMYDGKHADDAADEDEEDDVGDGERAQRASRVEDETSAAASTKTAADAHSGRQLSASASQKVYVARVHGRVDVAALARTQHHCTLRRRRVPADNAPSSPAEASSGVDSADDELVLRRPVGCIDHHCSLYWCPDAALTEAWGQHRCELIRRDAEERATTATARSSHDQGSTSQPAADNAKGKWSRTPAAIAAKHEKMRQLTRGSAGRSAALFPPHVFSSIAESSATAVAEVASAPSFPTPGADAASSPAAGEAVPTSVARHMAQYLDTLRSATTVLRVEHYDVARDETVVRCTLGTGRTHQLRVHLASLGHPIVHDSKYIAMEAFLRLLTPRACSASSPHLVSQDAREGCGRNSSTSSTTTTEEGVNSGSSALRVLRTGKIDRADLRDACGARQAADTPLALFYAATTAEGSLQQSSSSEADREKSGGKDTPTHADGASSGIAAAAAPPAWKTAIFADSRLACGCVCPDAICLHAWRYTLLDSERQTMVQVEVPLPSWARPVVPCTQS